MEVRDGFIVGIFNYCDRWCEACAFTSRCRLFVDLARYEAMLDPGMNAIVEASVRPQEAPPPPPKWMEELIERANDEASRMTPEDLARAAPTMARAHREIYERAVAYAIWVGEWLPEHASDNGDRTTRDTRDPVSIVRWFAPLIPSKVHRALSGLAAFDGDREFPPDHEGAAKVAIVGIERSLVAWRQLVATERVARSAAPCTTELEWLRDRLDEAIPRARAFVRPGFDEPDAAVDLA